MKTVKIYCLKDPITNEIRYVGKTNSPLRKRLSAHCREKPINKTYKYHWIQSLIKKGIRPLIELIEEVSIENWEEKEIYWIDYYKKINPKLTNHTKGGQGQRVGFKHTPEAIEKIRKASKIPNKGRFSKENRGNREKAKENCKKIILQYDLEGNFINEYKGIHDTAKKLKINPNSIIACLKGKIKSAGKFQWEYYNENYLIKILPYK